MRGVVIALALGLIAPCATARAQVANGAVFGDWTVTCAAETTARTLCALSQTVVARQDSAFLAEIGLNPGAGGVVMVLRTPSAMLLPVQPAYRVGADDPVALTWRSCAGDFCTAIGVLDETRVDALRRGRTMTVGYQRLSDPVAATFEVSLMGVTAGLAALSAH